MSVQDHVVIVTGASRGIGAATVLELASQGCKVVLAARSLGAIQNLAETIRSQQGQALALACDVTDDQAINTVVQQTLAHFGKVTALINNAGVIEPIARLEHTDVTQWREAIQINLIGAYLGIRAVLPYFYQQGHGIIINVSSGAASTPLEGWSAYCSSKAGLAMLTQSIALEAKERGIKVYGLAPGLVDTEMQGQIRASGINRVSQVPRETLSSPEDAAKSLTWLCLHSPQDLSGQELDIRDTMLRERIGLEQNS